MASSISVWFLSALSAFVGWFLWERAQRKTRPVAAGHQPHIALPHGQEWTLYHNSFSLCSKKIRVCLAEYNVAYDSVAIDLIETGQYQNISSDFLRVNPAATVPVLLHYGHPVYESHEQLKYLADRVDHDGLLVPQGRDQLEVMNMWIYKTSLIGDDPFASLTATAGNAVPGLTIPIFASMISRVPAYKIIEGLLFHRIKKRATFFLVMKLAGLQRFLKPRPVSSIINRSIEAMSAHLSELELQLAASKGPWICGRQFTLADVGMMVIFDRLREGDWLDLFITDRPLLHDYWQALRQRDSFRAGCQEFEHPLVVFATQNIVDLKEAGQWPTGLRR